MPGIADKRSLQSFVYEELKISQFRLLSIDLALFRICDNCIGIESLLNTQRFYRSTGIPDSKGKGNLNDSWNRY